MSKMTVSTEIDAPQDKVFDLIADLEGAAERIEGITKIEVLTDGPVGKGTRWKETRKRMGTEEMEISAFEPPTGYDVTSSSCGCTWTVQMRCTPKGERTELSMAMDWRANTFFAKLMSPMGFFMKGMMRKCVAKDLANIKDAAESS